MSLTATLPVDAAGDRRWLLPLSIGIGVFALLLSVLALKQRHAQRVFNGYEFGGYLIAAGVPPFIDGRAELYGEQFVADHHRAVSLRDIGTLARLLSDYRVDATLLAPSTPPAHLLDHLDACSAR